MTPVAAAAVFHARCRKFLDRVAAGGPTGTTGADGLGDEARVWLTRAEAAAYARCSLATIDRAVRRGELRSVIIGGDHGRLRRFRREWLDAWLADAGAG